jgi:hypothetical protein
MNKSPDFQKWLVSENKGEGSQGLARRVGQVKSRVLVEQAAIHYGQRSKPPEF